VQAALTARTARD
jgi:hypothetical protein